MYIVIYTYVIDLFQKYSSHKLTSLQDLLFQEYNILKKIFGKIQKSFDLNINFFALSASNKV